MVVSQFRVSICLSLTSLAPTEGCPDCGLLLMRTTELNICLLLHFTSVSYYTTSQVWLKQIYTYKKRWINHRVYITELIVDICKYIDTLYLPWRSVSDRYPLVRVPMKVTDLVKMCRRQLWIFDIRCKTDKQRDRWWVWDALNIQQQLSFSVTADQSEQTLWRRDLSPK